MRTVLKINEDWLFIKNEAAAPKTTPQDGERVNLPHT